MVFRWIALAIFLATIGVSGYLRRRAHAVTGSIPRSREAPGLIAGRLFVSLPLFGGVLAWLANPGWMSWASIPLPPWVRWTGVVIGLLVLPAAFWVLVSLGESVSETILTKRDHRLVTTGPYQWVRHPLYAVGIALFASIGLMAANWFILLWAGIALVAVRLVIIPREEENLVAVFGDDYRRYRARTGALGPALLRSVAR